MSDDIKRENKLKLNDFLWAHPSLFEPIIRFDDKNDKEPNQEKAK